MSQIKPIIIGLVGRRGTGKSAAAAYLCKEFDAVELTFAQPLRDIAEIFGFTDAEIYGVQADKERKNAIWQVSFRDFATICGTELFRNALPEHLPTMQDCWVQILERRITQQLTREVPPEIIVVSDVRFENEAQMIKKLGGYLVRINRKTALDTDQHAQHASETEQTDIEVDHSIDNTETLAVLHRELALYVICICERNRILKPLSYRTRFVSVVKELSVIVIIVVFAIIGIITFNTSNVDSRASTDRDL